MNENKKKSPFRILVLITTPKISDKATKMYYEGSIPVHYKLNAFGTATNEMLDILGLGSSDKKILISMLPKSFADKMLQKLHKELGINAPGKGIAFTLPISGANNQILKILKELNEENIPLKREEDTYMEEAKNVLIAAIVNQGYSEAVMDAARANGAGGGTVLHSRSVSNEQIMSFWGLGVQEEKEIVLIVSENENKLKIMQSISEKCGVRSEAKGIIVSIPIDNVIGLENL